MADVSSFSKVIERWANFGDFAKDIGVTRKHAYGMWLRDSIPIWYWGYLVKNAHKRGYHEITRDLLYELADDKALTPKPQRMRLRPVARRTVPRERSKSKRRRGIR